MDQRLNHWTNHNIVDNRLRVDQVNKGIVHIGVCRKKAIGLLVLLSFDIAVFTPAAYQRHHL